MGSSDSTVHTPLVSIVLPTFKRAQWLKSAAAECLAQTYRNIELIIVDDCSPDNTPDVCREIAELDPRVRIHRNAVNKKLPASLNQGFSLAQGEYWTWTSDDNRFRLNAIEEMVAALEANPNAGLVYAGFTAIDENDTPMRRVMTNYLQNLAAGDPPQMNDRTPARLHLSNVVNYCFLYRRSVADQIGGYAEDLFLAEDYDYWLRIASRFPIIALDRDLYLAREHGGSLTSTRSRDVQLAAAEARRRNLPAMSYLKPGDFAEAYADMASLVAASGNLPKGRQFLWAAFRHSPSSAFRRSPKGLLLKAILPNAVYQAGRSLITRS